MTDFKSKTYTNEQIEAILAEYKQSGDPITVFCKNRGHKPAYQTLKGWLDAVDQAAPAKNPAPAASTPTTPEGIKAEIARLQGAYKASLLSKVDRLKSDIEKLQQELAAAESELEEITT
ncbi:hypothetical protein PFLUOLIPICF7_01745 [Pseudomonas simiae]|uniref:hypothetical protein n=1 Tax=Pseudomonas simiae TaxID=321846 RepID=UPI0005D8DF3D|nr:hypothetical protein [Pseudomonas simiae]AJZ96911.1 hypothetical protein PFLUOLIPICF7_01745 [Pseudomonas simiae]